MYASLFKVEILSKVMLSFCGEEPTFEFTSLDLKSGVLESLDINDYYPLSHL